MLGISLQELRDDADAKDELLLRMKRKMAETKAIELLKDRAGNILTYIHYSYICSDFLFFDESARSFDILGVSL